MRPVELLRDNRSKDIILSVQDAVRVRYKGFRSMMDLSETTKPTTEFVPPSKTKLNGIAQVGFVLRVKQNIRNLLAFLAPSYFNSRFLPIFC